MAYRYPPLPCESSSRPCTPAKRFTLAQITRGVLSSTDKASTSTEESVQYTADQEPYPILLDWMSVSNVARNINIGVGSTVNVSFPYTSLFAPGYTSLTTLPAPPSSTFNTIVLEEGKTYNITAVVNIEDPSVLTISDPLDCTLTMNTNSINNPSTSTIYGSGERVNVGQTFSIGSGITQFGIVKGQWTIKATSQNKYIVFRVQGSNDIIIAASFQIRQLF